MKAWMVLGKNGFPMRQANTSGWKGFSYYKECLSSGASSVITKIIGNHAFSSRFADRATIYFSKISAETILLETLEWDKIQGHKRGEGARVVEIEIKFNNKVSKQEIHEFEELIKRSTSLLFIKGVTGESVPYLPDEETDAK